jgi:hypothetical protein
MSFAYSCNFMGYTCTFFPHYIFIFIFVIKQFIWDPAIGSQPPSLMFFYACMQVPYITDIL